jgi:glycosyltransferase involved in cell wall biosynthesis
MSISVLKLNSEPLLSVITVCFNSSSTICETLHSVRNQKTPLVEYIVVDGQSIDGTVDIINGNLDIVDKFISEPDEGLYDAMNKGISLSKGRFLLFLNSDDYLRDGGVDAIFYALGKVDDWNNCIVCGVTIKVDKENKEIGRLALSELRLMKRYKFNPFPHPSTLVSRDLFLKCSGFDCSYSIAADYDLFLRALALKPKVLMFDDVVSYMREGGASDELGDWAAMFRHRKEIFAIQKKYIPAYVAVYYSLEKIIQISAKRIFIGLIKCWRANEKR